MEEEKIKNNSDKMINDSNKKAIIAILIVVIILIGAIVYFVFFKNNASNTGGNNQQKINNNDSAKIYKTIENACQNFKETYNGINIEMLNAQDNDVDGCVSKLLLNSKPISMDEFLPIKSIGIYGDYVIIYVLSSGGSWVELFDTKSNDYIINEGVQIYKSLEFDTSITGGYSPDSFTLDDDGILIMYTANPIGIGAIDPDPNYKHIKTRMKYGNGKLLLPEIVDKYN